MSITFELPPDIEQTLRRQLGDLSKATKEAALVELYRQQKLTHRDLGRALGLCRLETEAVLKHHDVVDDLPDQAEHDAAVARLRAIER